MKLKKFNYEIVAIFRLCSSANKTYKIVKHIICFGRLMQLGKLCFIADGDLSNVKQRHLSNLQSFVARFVSILTYVTIYFFAVDVITDLC